MLDHRVARYRSTHGVRMHFDNHETAADAIAESVLRDVCREFRDGNSRSARRRVEMKTIPRLAKKGIPSNILLNAGRPEIHFAIAGGNESDGIELIEGVIPLTAEGLVNGECRKRTAARINNHALMRLLQRSSETRFSNHVPALIKAMHFMDIFRGAFEKAECKQVALPHAGGLFVGDMDGHVPIANTWFIPGLHGQTSRWHGIAWYFEPILSLRETPDKVEFERVLDEFAERFHGKQGIRVHYPFMLIDHRYQPSPMDEKWAEASTYHAA